MRPPTKSPTKRKHPQTDSRLPLYHPRGELALSLPLLDASSLGLPVLVQIEDSPRSGARATSNTKRPASSKLRDATTVAPIAEPVANPPDPIPNKPTPRKRRAGAGGGAAAAAKRKRKDVDDADAPYPATKRRAVRSRQAKDQVDAGSPGPGADVPPTPESAAEPLPETARRATRGTRSRAARRTSSESAGGSVQPQTPRMKEMSMQVEETVVAPVSEKTMKAMPSPNGAMLPYQGAVVVGGAA